VSAVPFRLAPVYRKAPPAATQHLFRKTPNTRSRKFRSTAAHDDTEFVVFLGDAQAFFRLVGLALTIPHGGIETVLAQQRRMRAALGNLPVLQHDDLVG